MTRYTVKFIPSALRQFKKLPPDAQPQVQLAIDRLAETRGRVATRNFTVSSKLFTGLTSEISAWFMRLRTAS